MPDGIKGDGLLLEKNGTGGALNLFFLKNQSQEFLIEFGPAAACQTILPYG